MNDPLFQVHTFGCKVNTYDSGLIQKNFKQSELKLNPNVKVHVLNTCAVTAEATKEAVRTIRRIKAKEPFATVIVTGCGAQVDTEAFRNLPGADLEWPPHRRRPTQLCRLENCRVRARHTRRHGPGGNQASENGNRHVGECAAIRQRGGEN